MCKTQQRALSLSQTSQQVSLFCLCYPRRGFQRKSRFKYVFFLNHSLIDKLSFFLNTGIMDYNLTLFKDSVKDILLTPLTSGFGNMNINTNTSATNSSGANNLINNSEMLSPS